ncbi:hypothetical protein PMZ80_007610 [Knufia obscura]|uniref:DUF1275 domain protein n=1 Tax=Knufia obscura TaxID=1635080 RepID=A0ABR0RHV6_9EURO|nr:hypothetical protein PMZ80_007610 [Knufia obscura]
MSSSSAPPHRPSLAVTFVDVERADMERTGSNIDLEKFNSAAPTLNNTPSGSRNPSPDRKKVSSRSPTPSPKQVDIEAMDSKERINTISRYTNDELDIAWMGGVIITCFFTSGLIDAVAFNSWNCFVGMQTGNTIFAALGLGGLPTQAHEQQFLKSFVAIGSFCMGTIFFNIMHRFPTGLHNQPNSRKRSIFVLSFLIQTLLIIIAAALVTVGVVSNQPFVMGQFSSGSHITDDVDPDDDHRNYIDMIPIVILAFEAAGQVCLSRVLSLIELPTIVLSTLYHDWTGDLLGTRQLWRQSSGVKDFVFNQGRRQNKRLMAIIALFLGGVVGGEMWKSKVGMAGALWVAAFLKGCIVVSFALWKKQKQDDEELEK